MKPKSANSFNLDAIADALELVGTGIGVFVNLDTGESIPVTELDQDLLRRGREDFEELSDWEKEVFPQVKEAVENRKRYLKLPDSFEIHEWELMKRFAKSQKDVQVVNELMDALHGSGAFRLFKSQLDRFNIREDWYKFKKECLKEIALEWCKDNKIKLQSI